MKEIGTEFYYVQNLAESVESQNQN